MRTSFAITMILLAAWHSAAAHERVTAPNGLLEAFTTAKEPDGTGMKLFVRHRRTGAPAVLLLQNDRWIDAKWSPDSRFLAVIDHPDGGIADVYVFGITAATRLDRLSQPSFTTRLSCGRIMFSGMLWIGC
jgi:hypothetical protein